MIAIALAALLAIPPPTAYRRNAGAGVSGAPAGRVHDAPTPQLVQASVPVDAGVTFQFSIPLVAADECACPASVNGVITGSSATMPLSVARTTIGACTRGRLTRTAVDTYGGYVSGISADAGVVFCPIDTVRVARGSATNYGVLSEGPMLNYVYGSKVVNGTDWDVAGLNGAAAPTETANAAEAPDGTMTAERYEFPATTGDLASGGRSIVYPAVANVPPPSVCNGEKTSCQVYIKNHSYVDGGQVVGVGATGTDGPGGFRVVRCPIDSHSFYTQCLLENMTVTAGGGGSLVIGTLSYYDGTEYAAADVDVIWPQCECNDHATSNFPTVQGAVGTRGKDDPTVTVPFIPSGSNLTMSAEIASVATIQNSRVAASLETSITGGSGTNYLSLGSSTSRKVECTSLVANVTDTFEGPLYAAGTNTASCVHDGDLAMSACLGSTCDAGVLTNKPTRAAVLGLAKFNGTSWVYQPDDVVIGPVITSAMRSIIILVGDSIIAGTYVNADARPIALIRAADGNAVDVESRGVGGYTIEQSYAVWVTELAAIVSTGLQARTTMVMAAGTNSAPAPDDGGTAITNVSWHIEQALYNAWDAGVAAYATTLTPRGDSTSHIDGVNATLYAWAADAGRSTAILDTWSDLVNDAGTALADGCGQADGVHPTDGGTRRLTYRICSGTGACSVTAGSPCR